MTIMSKWVKQDLYGGAITTVIPQKFLDVSMIRQVPDTQEVFVNSRMDNEVVNDGLAFNESVIVDLLQRVKEDDDMKALDEHLREISDLNGAQKWEILDCKQQGSVINSLVVEIAYKWGKKSLEGTVVMCIGLIRLNEYDTDVIISVIVPVSTESELQSLSDAVIQKRPELLPSRIKTASELLEAMTSSFKVEDPTLFV